MTQPPPPDLDVLLTHAAFVRAAARGVLGGDSEVEDVVQETWLRALDRQPKEPGALKGWLKRVARNLAIDRRRSGVRRAQREKAAARPEALPAVEDVLEREEARQRLVRALLALESPYRDALLLRWYEGLPVADVAERLGVPHETARTHLRRGLERLRARMDAGRDGRPGAWSLGLAPWALDRGGAAVAGGMAMKKIGTAVLALALVGGGAGVALHLAGERAPDSEARPDLASATSVHAAAEAAVRGPTLQGSAPSELALLAPVDLERADRDLDVFGVVVDAAGAPIANATLQVVHRPWQRGQIIAPGAWEIERLGATTRSAVDGTFVLRMRRGERFDLRCSARGFATMDRRDCQSGQRLRLTLTPGATLILELVAEDGRSTQGTRVKLHGYAIESSFEREGVTDELGLVRFEGLPASVRARVNVEPTELGLYWGDVDVPAAGERRVRIPLPVGRTLRGRVTDAATGAPIADAKVALGWTQQRARTTDAAGVYVFPGWHEAQGAPELSVSAPGWGTVKVVVSSREVVDVALERGDRVVGRVLAPGGAPLAGALVAVVPVGERAGSVEGETGQCVETQADGRFSFDGLRRDQEHGVVVMASGLGRVLYDVAPHERVPGTIDLGDLALAMAGSIEGRVVDAEGRACADLEVFLRGANSDRRRFVGKEAASETPFYGQSEEARTDDLGRFRFVDLAAGTYKVTARREGQPDVRTLTQLSPAGVVRDLLLTLPEGRPLTVLVVDEGGRPVPTAWVSVSGAQDHVNGVGVNELGRATVYVRPQDTTLGAVQIGQSPGQPRLLPAWGVPIPTEGGDVVLTLHESFLVTGRVQDASGKPISRASVEVQRRAVPKYSVQAAEDGGFRLEVARDEVLQLTVNAIHAARQGGGTELRPARGEQRDVRAGARDVVIVAEVVLMDRTVTVAVLDPGGQPVQGARVTATAESGGIWREVQTDATGRAHVIELADQLQHITVHVPRSGADQRPVAHRPLTVRPDGQTVEVRLYHPIVVIGRLTAGEVKDFTGAMVSVESRNASGSRQPRPCSPEGVFALFLDPELPTPWNLVATGAGALAGWTGHLELDRPPTGKVSIELKPPVEGVR